ncbi:tetratricopeptide repeat protein [Candidatus Phyllobacterium onerii]|uniref:tetratricopeptide repeat protein n=1 Tax=Candidatus Phyllobacterium onerii TaxID=3020828 RepID=UPI00232E36DD|nr:tetratricopeptide repeat protein [Phyllobacterium sp. IY22]
MLTDSSAPNKINRYKVIAAILAVAALIGFRAIAIDPHDKGDVAYLAENYTEVYKVWKPLAEKGYARGQYDVGLLYANGYGMPQDNVTAAYWYRKSAEQGNSDAQRNLGLMYAKGEGVGKNYGRASEWFKKAAEQGNAEAQKYLDEMAEKGLISAT